MAEQRIPLAQLIQHITSELRKAHEKAMAEGSPVMKFEECEFEFAVEAEVGGEAGFNVWVINAGGNYKRNESNVIRVKYSALADIVAPVHTDEPRTEKIERRGKKIK